MRRLLIACLGLGCTMAATASAQETPATSPVGQPPPAAPLAPPPSSPITPPPGDPSETPTAAPQPASMPSGGPQISIPAALERIKEYIAAGRIDLATQGLETVLRIDKDNFDARLLLAKMLETKQDFMGARSLYRELAPIQPNNFDVNLGLGRIYVAQQYWRQAPRYLEAADRVARPEQQATVKMLLAAAYRGAGQLQLALAAAEAAVKAEPQNYDARAALLGVRLDMKQVEAAAEESRVLIEIAARQVESSPGSAEPLNRLLRAHEALVEVLRQNFASFYETAPDGSATDKLRTGMESGAAAQLKQIVDSMTKMAELRQRLAYFDALVFAQRASQLAPRDPAILMTEAALLLSTNQTEKAIQRCQQILEIQPDHAEAIRVLSHLQAPMTSQPAGPDAAAAAGSPSPRSAPGSAP